MAKKPFNLIYGVTDKPPVGTAVLLGLQHVFVISVGWIFVVVIVTAFGGTREQAGQVIQIWMIASGVATILQARTKGPVGSGYLCPLSIGPAYITASILAGKLGGLPLLFGLTAISGLFEALLSRLVQRLSSISSRSHGSGCLNGGNRVDRFGGTKISRFPVLRSED
jgi:NCS2 family nucleobase:cation symporter-2